MMRMIEIYDMQDATADGIKADKLNLGSPLDITPQLVSAACNVISDYCRQRSGCKGCDIHNACSQYFSRSPDTWVVQEEIT